MTTALVKGNAAFADLQDDTELQARVVIHALKTSFEGRITYRQGDCIEGAALARNLGRGDIALKLNRYIAPGAAIDLELECLTYRGLPIQMRAVVESCERDENGKAFVAFAHVSRSAFSQRG